MNERTALLFRTAGPLSPLQRVALVTAGLAGWRRYVAAILLGALAAVALPPFDFAPVLWIAMPGLVWLEDGSADWRGSFALGWSFGLGFFVAGLYWIGAALLVDPGDYGWLLPFAVLGVPAGLGVFTGAALVVCHETCRRCNVGGSPRILVFTVAWAGAEYLRGHILTGFPWNLLGYA
ncbi:MAG: apolipoprotein N-acyltransferase, partial [Stellaceae bacterium]